MVEKKSTKAGKPSKSPELRERSPSLPVGWVPTWEVPVALKGVEWAKKGGEKLAEWINSEGPLALQILDSRAGDTKYTVELSATNLTVHSMYLDSFTLVFPAELNLPISLKRLTSFGAGSLINEQSQPKSPLIRPGQSLEFTIEFP